MNIAILKNRGPYYLILILSLSIMMFSNSINKNLYLVFGFFCWLLIYKIERKRELNVNIIFIKMIIYSLPLSFTNIWGGSYDDSILSWYNIFFVILVLKYLFSNLFSRESKINSLSIYAFFLILITVIPLLNSMQFLDGAEQFINLIIPLLLIIVGNGLRNKITHDQGEELILTYICSVKIAAIGVIVQYLSINYLNIKVGNYAFLGGYRHSYGFLFSDVSFLSLFIVSGATLLYFSKNKYIKENNLYWVLQIIFLLVTSIITSARTGIVSFIILFCIYSFFRIFKLLAKGSLSAVFIALFNVTIIWLSYILVLRTRGSSNFSDSGRNMLNEVAFKVFLENPILGIGLGKNYYFSTIGTLPHNLFFQSLAQGGLIYVIPLVLFLIMLLISTYKTSNVLFPVLICIFIGAQFIPNIFNSRFLAVLFIMVPLVKFNKSSGKIKKSDN